MGARKESTSNKCKRDASPTPSPSAASIPLTEETLGSTPDETQDPTQQDFPNKEIECTIRVVSKSVIPKRESILQAAYHHPVTAFRGTLTTAMDGSAGTVPAYQQLIQVLDSQEVSESHSRLLYHAH